MNRIRLGLMAACTLGALVGLLALAGPARAGDDCNEVKVPTGKSTYTLECVPETTEPTVTPTTTVPETTPATTEPTVVPTTTVPETTEPTVTPTTTAPTVTPTTPGSTETPTTAPTPSAAPKDCEAYVYTGTTTNLCAQFPGEPDKVNCGQVGYRVTLKDPEVDPWGLDGSGDNIGTVGVGCESNPLKPRPSSSPSAVQTTAPPISGVGDGDSLPLTGAKISTLIGLAALALAGGILLIWWARRRRVDFTA